MVTHVTDVKPLAAVLTYLDQDSNTEVYQEVSDVTWGVIKGDMAASTGLSDTTIYLSIYTPP